MATRKVYNTSTQKVEDAELSVENREIVVTFKNGHFLKYPANIDAADFGKQLDALETAHAEQEIITPEVLAAQEAELANAYELIGETNPNESDTTTDAEKDS